MSERPTWVGRALIGDRRALVDQWRYTHTSDAPTVDWTSSPIPRRPSDGAAPLSFAQERLWFLEQLHPDQSIYVVPVVLRLSVPVSAPILAQALDEIVRRHEVLRSAFIMVDDRPCQFVDAGAAPPFRHIDLRGLPENARADSVQEHFRREVTTPFDLSSPCRLRSLLMTLGDADQILVCTFHHSAFDGWSTTPFIGELRDLYAAFARGERSPLAPLTIQYADYACWQRQVMEDPARRRELLDYWTRRLGNLRVPEIPSDFARPARPTYRAGRQTLLLTAPLVSGLKILAQRESASRFMALLAAVAVVIQRYTARDDVSIGTSVAGRMRAELEPLIGCCLNTLALRTDLSGDPRVSELLGRVRETVLGAFAHQALPFELLLQELVPTRDLSRTPLFQVYVNYLNVGEFDPVNARSEIASGELSTGGSEDEAPAAEDDTHAAFDLALYARPAGERLALSLVYARDLFDRATADRFLRDVRTIIGAMAEHPDERIAALPLAIDDQEAARPRVEVPAPSEWQPWTFGSEEPSIDARFLSVSQRFADRAAVRVGPRVVTYRALADRSARIAAYLQSFVGHQTHVALLLGHDELMVSALLGVLASGAAYVPLDPAHPPDRLAAIVESSRPVAVIADEPRLSMARAIVARAAVDAPVLSADSIMSSADVARAGSTPVATNAIAYLLYTSGSTGWPKGVVQSHRNVMRHVRTYANSIRLTPDDRVMLLASYGFDASIMDIFGALLTGACLLPVDLRRDDASTIADALARTTILHATPTVYRHLLNLSSDADLSSIRVVVLGGEAATRTDLEVHHQRFSNRSVLVNGLGPTESTMALQFVADRATVIAGPLIPVGFPVTGTTVTLLNDERREVGALAVGEITVTSEQVALGYWNDESATAAAFVGDGRFRPRTYLTGDLGRRNRDGCIEFIGRKDAQIKVRGMRIEPAEIERALLAHAGIAAAVVVVSGETEDIRLIAHLVRCDGSALDIAALRRHLRERLPDAMVPDLFVAIDRLPMTVNGKLDRAALPAPDAANMLSSGGAEGEPPNSPMERLVAAVWCEVLGIAGVSRTASFFDLGGHSLLATQVVSRVRSTLNRAVPLRAIFESPTLKAFARVVEQSPIESPGSSPADVPSARAARERYKKRLTERPGRG